MTPPQLSPPPHLDLPWWRVAASARCTSSPCAQEPANHSHPIIIFYKPFTIKFIVQNGCHARADFWQMAVVFKNLSCHGLAVLFENVLPKTDCTKRLAFEGWLLRHGCTVWRRCAGCLKLQVFFRKRATDYKALLREMTYKNIARYGSLPPLVGLTPWKGIWGGAN